MNSIIDDQATDSELVQSCLGEFPYSTRSFEILLGRYEPAIYRYCLHYLRDHHDAEEVTMDTFAQVFFQLNQLEDASAFKNWLFRITGRQCADQYRKRARRRSLQEEFSHAAGDPSGLHGRQGSELRTTTAEAAMSRALHEISPQDREVLILRHVNELTFEEIAETAQITVSAGKMRLYRAEERLRQLLEPELGGEIASADLALMIFFHWGVTFHRPA